MHMNINATLMGQFILLLMIIVGVLAYWLARRRSERPALIASQGTRAARRSCQ